MKQKAIYIARHSLCDDPCHAQFVQQLVEGCAFRCGCIKDDDLALGPGDRRVEVLHICRGGNNVV